MITPKLKDFILNELIVRYEMYKRESFPLFYDKCFSDMNIGISDLRIILNQFERMGLISDLRDSLGSDAPNIQIEADLFDWHNRGGFVAQEEILLANLEKLGYELDELTKHADPSFLDRIDNITKIAASIATFINAAR